MSFAIFDAFQGFRKPRRGRSDSAIAKVSWASYARPGKLVGELRRLRRDLSPFPTPLADGLELDDSRLNRSAVIASGAKQSKDRDFKGNGRAGSAS
jgi:hypothetical protein